MDRRREGGSRPWRALRSPRMPPPTRPPIDRARIEHVAKLANLSLDDAAADKLAHELDAILRYVEELGTLDTKDVPPTANVQLDASAWRNDEVQPCLTHEEALSQAPRSSEGGFAVPAFVENG
jgi:aspartyl-tRNA(Asn)/glutamyl-tRNA(Gln) amidotransferase subunit C